MTKQLTPLGLVVAAGLAHAGGRPGLAFYLLLAAIPVIVSAALECYGDVVADEGGSVAQTALWTAALVLIVVTTAVPPLASIGVTACLALVGIQGVITLGAELRRRPTAS